MFADQVRVIWKLLKNVVLQEEELDLGIPHPDDDVEESAAEAQLEEEKKSRKRAIIDEQVKESQHCSAAKMLKRAVNLCLTAKLHDNVSVPLDSVDRGPCDSKSLVCVVLKVNDDKSVELGTREGKLGGSFYSNTYKILKDRFITASDVPDKI